MTPETDISVFHPHRPGVRAVLGDLEAEIMEIVWSRPTDQGTTVRDVYQSLHRRRRIAYTTVMTTMARLARKNLLRARKFGQAYVYRPAFTPDEFLSHIAGRMLESLLIGFTNPTIERLKTLSDPQVAKRARQLLEEISPRRKVGES